MKLGDKFRVKQRIYLNKLIKEVQKNPSETNIHNLWRNCEDTFSLIRKEAIENLNIMAKESDKNNWIFQTAKKIVEAGKPVIKWWLGV